MTVGILGSLARAVLGRISRLRGRHTVAFVTEEPDTPVPRVVYVVGEDGHRWFAAFDCPCGCGEVIKLSLVPGDRPGWTLHDHVDGTASVAPSVWRQVGCKSHFWLRKGKIDWC